MLDEEIELRMLNEHETLTQKIIKKIIFIFISIIFPILEIIGLIFQSIDICHELYLEVDRNKIYFIPIYIFRPCAIVFFTILSLICTWALISICFLDKKLIIILLTIKVALITIIIILSLSLSNVKKYFIYNLLGYAIFYIFILIYKSFKKGII